jgi:hypothetical protein
MQISSKRLLVLGAVAILVGSFGLLLPQKASGIGVLTGTWSCNAYATCTFTRTSSNHATYQWNFGDGTSTGLTTATPVFHTYDMPADNVERQFTVYFIGYATSGGGSPDNIIACNVTTYRTGVGGDPTTFSGNCS